MLYDFRVFLRLSAFLKIVASISLHACMYNVQCRQMRRHVQCTCLRMSVCMPVSLRVCMSSHLSSCLSACVYLFASFCLCFWYSSGLIISCLSAIVSLRRRRRRQRAEALTAGPFIPRASCVSGPIKYRSNLRTAVDSEWILWSR